MEFVLWALGATLAFGAWFGFCVWLGWNLAGSQ